MCGWKFRMIAGAGSVVYPSILDTWPGEVDVMTAQPKRTHHRADISAVCPW
jgi:hypothetical protein